MTTKKIYNKLRAKIKNSTNFCKRTVSQPSKPRFMKTKRCSVSNIVQFFSVRLLNNVTSYKIKKNKNNIKNGKLYKKSENFE